ncbi:MAG: hypothetical protein EWV57_10345 [Microcystis aeruginosa Ma_QC_Ch_20071001_S25D]|uniref:Uncharacterized protein n=1 Tax=Microcystis aeruginosa Ma_QC_Ch_20071001_S25D TaxID=2486250 RepID=A0A552FUQ8_MICAE|nr:MAG: hypothetical protein EWV57_10345 [Microcystis aeruginosa Ma_QC_Ch_20071001_S25D]TRU56473.1 MAG: hypothetical protein EWV90_22570 [Microcystis aeruginosa Ma_QC_Ch_20071001_M135]
MGVGGWGVGFYPFSGGQLPNVQGKSSLIFPLITPSPGTFGFQKGLKVLSNKVFRFIWSVQSPYNKKLKFCKYCRFLPVFGTFSPVIMTR